MIADAATGRASPAGRRRARRHAEGRVQGRGPHGRDRSGRPARAPAGRRGGDGPGAAPAGRPRDHRDRARVRVRQRRRRPVERRRGLGRAAARSTPTARPGASATACGPGPGWRSPSSCPTPSGARGGAGSPTWPSAAPGIGAVVDLRGTTDDRGRELQVTEVAVVDELAGAAELVMGKSSGIPVAVVRGVDPRGSAPATSARRSSAPPTRTSSAERARLDLPAGRCGPPSSDLAGGCDLRRTSPRHARRAA